MKQVVQNIRTGKLSLESVPVPMVSPGHVLIANQRSLISAGTEKMVMELAKKSLLGKARERPDHVRRVLEKIRNEGLFNTIHQVRKKLDEPLTMGYSSAGIVLALGSGVQEFKVGDRVASNGPHADVVCVPRNLCALIPDKVSFDAATFAVMGSIGLHGLRLADARLGEIVFVIGLGLVGQLTVALARSAGCRVVGADPDAARCELARNMGAELSGWSEVEAMVDRISQGRGADSVLITASTTSQAPIDQACRTIRKKGRIVLVGVCELKFDRRPLYFKEAEFVVSCSYGPGRYDPDYEDRGIDYPAAYVRWTEQRNLQAVLAAMAHGGVDVQPLVSHQFDIDDAEDAYQLIETGREPFLGVVLRYAALEAGPVVARLQRHIDLRPRASRGGLQKPRCAVLGAGNFSRLVIVPAIQKTHALEIASVTSAHGLTAMTLAREVDAESACTDEDAVFGDASINTIFSITRHDLHARHVLAAIQSRKNIFVEKPLCLTLDELIEIEKELRQAATDAPLVMVGFNRRFAPLARQLKLHFSDVPTPLAVSIRVNAGEVPADHWTQHQAEGGGRIVGEACHAIDLALFLNGSLPLRVYAQSVRNPAKSVTDDDVVITLLHANGGVASIAYFASGDKACPKERIEVFGGGRTGILDDFRVLTTWNRGRKTTTRTAQQKGYQQEIQMFVDAILTQGQPPMMWHEMRAVTLASLLAVQSLREGVPLDIPTGNSRLDTGSPPN